MIWCLAVLLVISNLWWLLVLYGSAKRHQKLEYMIREAQALNATILKALQESQQTLATTSQALMAIVLSIPTRRGH